MVMVSSLEFCACKSWLESVACSLVTGLCFFSHSSVVEKLVSSILPLNGLDSFNLILSQPISVI